MLLFEGKPKVSLGPIYCVGLFEIFNPQLVEFYYKKKAL